MQRLPPEFYARDATEVAPDLLGKVLLAHGTEFRITEVEAYTQDDPASHSFRGRTPRNDAMFGPAGHWYVYLIYGLHHCLNVVTGADGDGQAVLLRSMWGPGVASGRTSGPGRLASYLRADRSWNGRPVELYDRGDPAPEFVVSPRIGITKAADWPRRWLLTASHLTQ